MNDEEKLILVKKIRDYRVTTKRKKVTLSEHALNRVKSEFSSLSENVSAETKRFQIEKTETVERLFQQSSNVNDFFKLQKKEANFQNFLRNSANKKHELNDDIYKKSNILEENQKELFKAEKSLLKLEEFIKKEFEK